MLAISFFPSSFALFYVPQPAITLAVNPLLYNLSFIKLPTACTHTNKAIRVSILPTVIITTAVFHFLGLNSVIMMFKA